MGKLTESQIKVLTELALIRAIPDQELDPKWRESRGLKPLKPSRLKGLFESLITAVDMQLRTIPKPQMMDIDKTNSLIRQFGTISGWEYRQHPVVVNISFCLGLFEESTTDFGPKIPALLNDIIDFFDRKKPIHIRYFRSDVFAAEQWETLFL